MGCAVADFQVVFQVVSHVERLTGDIASHVERLGVIEEIHLLDRHVVDLFSESRRIRQRTRGFTDVKSPDAFSDDAPKTILLDFRKRGR